MSYTPELRGQYIDLSSYKSPDTNAASDFCEKLVARMNEFDKTLDQEHQVAMRLVSFGQDITFHVTHLGYSNPSLISFYGVLDDGTAVELVQHVSQISFLMMAVERLDPDEPKKPIGFLEEPVGAGEQSEESGESSKNED